ncbi:MAG: SatD family protein [Calditrichia bacterium]
MDGYESDRLYTVLIGDISGSKRLSGNIRYQTQLFMKSAIVQINEEFKHCIEAPMTITKGDEFQALIDRPSEAYRIIKTLQKMIYPVQIRYGLGVGQIYRMGGVLPIEMDGPAFHRANRALNLAKKKKTEIWFVAEDDLFDGLINTIFTLISAIKSRWNERHYHIFWKYQELGTYKSVANTEGVTPQAICDVFKNIRATDVLYSEEQLMKALDVFFEQLQPAATS